MKFAHLADCHIGAWTDSRMRELSHSAFQQAVAECIHQNVDFVLLCGDLFNTALPGIESLKVAVEHLKSLATHHIPVYAISGSHDYSPSGKTIIDVLEKAGLITSVSPRKENELTVVTDPKTGARIAGLDGLRGGLDMQSYAGLGQDALGRKTAFTIFMFHASLSEFNPVPQEIAQSMPASLLPQPADYYAGGHLHLIAQKMIPEVGLVSYPGPLFPNNYRELEELNHGGFHIVTTSPTLQIEYRPIRVCSVLTLMVDCAGLTPPEAASAIRAQIEDKELANTVVLLRLKGELSAGKPSQIPFRELVHLANTRGAYHIMKNISGLSSKEFVEVPVIETSVERIEENTISANVGQMPVADWDADKEKTIARMLMAALDTERDEGEKISDFEQRILSEARKILEYDKL